MPHESHLIPSHSFDFISHVGRASFSSYVSNLSCDAFGLYLWPTAKLHGIQANISGVATGQNQ
eukprot:1477595-Amphidinium_carterae.1